MANSVTFQTQLASIMEVLANAAVAEICELVDNGYAVLHLEISRSQKENESLKRKLRMMELKVARASALRSAGIGSSIFASSRARAHLISESRRTPSLEAPFQRGRDFHLASTPRTRCNVRDAEPPGDRQAAPKQGVSLPAALKPKSPPIIKMEKIDDDVFEVTDQQERLRTSDHGSDGGSIDCIVHTEATQPMSKQEATGQANASSCVWPSDETTKTHYPEPKNLHANKRSQSSDLEASDIPLDPVAFDCMLYEPHSHEPHSQHGSNSIPAPLAEDPGCSYSLKLSVNAGPAHSDHSSDFPFAVSEVARSVPELPPAAAYRDGRPREPSAASESQLTGREDIEAGSNAFLIDDDWVSHNTSSNVPSGFNSNDGLDKLFICSFCGKTLACLKNLKTHMRVHTGEKPFSCAQCGKRFSDSSNLKRHQSVHTGERRYGCMHCGKRFAQSGSLKVHMSVHTGCKQFKCPHCGKTFISANHLRRHISVHDGEKLSTAFQ